MADEIESKMDQDVGLKSGGNVEAKGPSQAPRVGPDEDETRSGGNIEAKGASHIGDERTPGNATGD